MSTPPPPGWYPAPHANDEQRYWDGTQWQEPEPVAADEPSETPTKRKKGKKALIVGGSIVAGIIVLGAIGGALGGNEKTTPQAQGNAAAPTPTASPSEPEEAPKPAMVEVPNVQGQSVADAIATLEGAGLKTPPVSGYEDAAAKVLATEPASGASVEKGTSVTLTVEEKPKLSLEQENAVRSARNYLSYSGFSRPGLIKQLEYEGFSTEVATFAADNADADWNAEAAEAAKNYLDYTSFSRQGLADQLAFEGYSQSEIDYALAAVGY